MKLEWLEDLLAILDEGTLSRAAAARCLTQPAFSRRIRVIEDHVGVELVERSRPSRLKDFALEQEDRMRELAAGLRQLTRDLKREDAEYRNQVVIASQHSITTSIAPALLRCHMPAELNFRLRSANREECYAMVMTRQADLALAYQTAGDRFAADDGLLEERMLGTDRLIPVFASSHIGEMASWLETRTVPAILYPRAVFLGRHMDREIVPHLPHSMTLAKRTETALTLAALQLSLAGIGIAWIPESLAMREIKAGALCDLSGEFPSSKLTVAAYRIDQGDLQTKAAASAWDSLPLTLPVL